MKKFYEQPKLDLVIMSRDDVIVTSGNDNSSNNGNLDNDHGEWDTEM